MFRAQFLGSLLFIVFLCISCNSDRQEDIKSGFRLLDPQVSGFDFTNILYEEQLTNPFNYVNLYMGGGVSIGDINNDGLQDIYMTSNMGTSKLFLNKGKLKFEDITLKARVATKGWCTASTMADINNDGWLDIYVCRSYHDDPDLRGNLMFINNGDGSFSERSKTLGINDMNYSICAAFFDYDLDGDLDLLTGNHPRYVMMPAKVHYDFWKNPVSRFSNRLFRNDGNSFTEQTSEAGILSYGHTLGLSITDFNLDGYPDIYISVDHAEPDYLFKNNANGTFTNVLYETMRQTSKSSMGLDVGDVNHDPYPDIFVSEMLSEDHFREKVNMDMTNIDRFSFFVDSMGYKYYQMHNFMHLNNGNNTFSDVSQLTNTHKSDWSWSALFMDFDNDSWQDLFVANGFYKNVYHKDNKKVLDSIMYQLGNDMAAKNRAAQEYSLDIPIDKIPNYFFKNKGDLNFEKYTEQAGLDVPTISTGSAYGDLDNDGDLDLVISNVGHPSMIYENISVGMNYIRFEFDHDPDRNAIGSRIYIQHDGTFQSRELYTTRGFQSSSEPFIHFGLGKSTIIESVEVVWPDGKTQLLSNIPANKTINLKYKDAGSHKVDFPVPDQYFNTIAAKDKGIDVYHHENIFRDYDVQVLLPHKMSEYGPFPAVGDVNGDKLDDIYYPGPHQQMGRLYIQNSDNSFSFVRQDIFFRNRDHEDGHSVFFDADGDGDNDLLVASAAYEFDNSNALNASRLYLNDGKGKFKLGQLFDNHNHPASCISLVDFDNDGDTDFFLGGRVKPHAYPFPGKSALFINNGSGKFTNTIDQFAPGLEESGMIRDAVWTDIDNDGDQDLITVGEWMPVSIWINENSILKNRTDQYFETSQTGWWNTIEMADLDNNGVPEFIIGNLGLNYKYKASIEKPFIVYAGDFDDNNTSDIALGTYYGDMLYPVRGKSCSTQQLPEFADVYKTYSTYASLGLEDVYGPRLEGALKLEVNNFASVIMKLNTETGKFETWELPRMAQISPVNGIVAIDLNGDNLKDLVLGGNLYQSEVETGRADAGNGLVLINQGNLEFKALTVNESGLYIPEDVKSLNLINNDPPLILVGINGGHQKIVEFRKKKSELDNHLSNKLVEESSDKKTNF